MTTQIQSLITAWNSATGQQVNQRAVERIAWEFLDMGFTENDLRLVVKHMLSFNRKHPDCPLKMQFHRVVGDTERFASMLAEFQAKERNRIKPPSPRETALNQLRPVVEAQTGTGTAMTVKEVLRKVAQ